MVRAHQPGPADAFRGRPNPPREFAQLPVPSPDMVHAARARLAGRFSTGVDALLWDAARQPMHDAEAISSVVSSAHGEDGPPPAALDFGAALIVLAALRLDIDRLEADLVDAVRGAGLDWEFIATTLRTSVQQAAKRQRLLSKRRALPTDRVRPAAAAGDGRPGGAGRLREPADVPPQAAG